MALMTERQMNMIAGIIMCQSVIVELWFDIRVKINFAYANAIFYIVRDRFGAVQGKYFVYWFHQPILTFVFCAYLSVKCACVFIYGIVVAIV